MGYRSQAKRRRQREAMRLQRSKVNDPFFVVDTSPDTSLVWRVLSARATRTMKRDLEDLGATLFAPGYTETVIIRGKKRALRRQYLGSYIIFGLSRDVINLEAIEAVQGVGGIIRNHGAHVRIPVVEVARLAERLTGDGVAPTMNERKAKLMLRQVVEVVGGPFDGFPGVVEELLDRGRVKVGVSIFGRVTPLELDPGQVKAA